MDSEYQTYSPELQQALKNLRDKTRKLHAALEAIDMGDGDNKVGEREAAIQVLVGLEIPASKARKMVTDLNPPPGLRAAEIIRAVFKK